MSSQAVIFANGRMCHPFCAGGDGFHAHFVLSGLQAMGYKAIHLGLLAPMDWAISEKRILSKLQRIGANIKASSASVSAGGHTLPALRRVSYVTGGYKAEMADAPHFFNRLRTLLKRLKPAAVMTQLDGAGPIIEICNECKTPVFLWVVDADMENIETVSMTPPASMVIFDSTFLAKKFSRYATAPWKVIYPLARRIEGAIPPPEARKAVVMINPELIKGGKVFVEAARLLPEIPFVASVWRRENIRGDIPSNMKFIKAGEKMEVLFRQARILLVPSQSEDAYPTVIPMAHSCGTPVIGSRAGGIAEAIGSGGITIKDYANAKAWAEAVGNVYYNCDSLRRFSAMAKRRWESIHSRQLSAIAALLANNK